MRPGMRRGEGWRAQYNKRGCKKWTLLLRLYFYSKTPCLSSGAIMNESNQGAFGIPELMPPVGGGTFVVWDSKFIVYISYYIYFAQ